MKREGPFVFATLGPEGTNHGEMVTAYARFRGLRNIQTLFIDDFAEALEHVANDRADFILICGVHPQCPTVVGEGSFRYGIHLMDTFISPSQPLGILTRREVGSPTQLALQPATTGYTDISGWSEHVHVSSIMRIAEGLLDGTYESGLTTIKVAEENSDKLRIDRTIGSPDDPWLVLGKQRVSDGKLVACKDAPVAEFFTTARW